MPNMFVEIDEWMDERIHIMKRLEELWEVMLCTSFAFGQMDWRQYAITYLQNHHMQSCKYYQTCIERCLVYLLHICIYICVWYTYSHIYLRMYVFNTALQKCRCLKQVVEKRSHFRPLGIRPFPLQVIGTIANGTTVVGQERSWVLDGQSTMTFIVFNVRQFWDLGRITYLWGNVYWNYIYIYIFDLWQRNPLVSGW